MSWSLYETSPDTLGGCDGQMRVVSERMEETWAVHVDTAQHNNVECLIAGVVYKSRPRPTS